MRFLFITAALLLFSCAMAAADDVQVADDQPLTEEQAKEIVFSVEEEMVKEIEEAVETINEVFGNPACSNETTGPVSESDLKVEKRGWGSKLWKKVKSKISKTKEKVKSAIQIARLKLATAIAGKRSEAESELEVEKRGWGSKLWKKVIETSRKGPIHIVHKSLGKRSEAESELEVEKRGWGKKLWKKVKKVIKKIRLPHIYRFPGKRPTGKLRPGKRSEPESELQIEKRGWGKFWKKVQKAVQTYSTIKTAVQIATAVGKRSEVESSPLELRERSETESELEEPEVPEDSPEAEIEFRADIAKLESALEVLNDVLEIAREAAKSE